ncbi:MAG: response regulator [Sulfitobacter sp.]|nr:response regulator [Sulfitobacter sp.]
MTNSPFYSDLSVLYLEDEPLIAFDTTDFLQELGFSEVKSAYKLKSAEQAISEKTFDLAILDINVDNNQTSLLLGSQLAGEGIPVIFASGNSFDAERLRAEGFEFLDKPFSYEDLESAICSALT